MFHNIVGLESQDPLRASSPTWCMSMDILWTKRYSWYARADPLSIPTQVSEISWRSLNARSRPWELRRSFCKADHCVMDSPSSKWPRSMITYSTELNLHASIEEAASSSRASRIQQMNQNLGPYNREGSNNNSWPARRIETNLVRAGRRGNYDWKRIIKKTKIRARNP